MRAQTEPVHVLQIHGTDDETIGYAGQDGSWGTFPSAAGSVSRWAAFNRCDEASAAVPPTGDEPPGFFDLISPAGDETTVTRHGNCPAGGSAELWTLAGGGHVPSFCAEQVLHGGRGGGGGDTCGRAGATGTERLSARMADWLLARRKP